MPGPAELLRRLRPRSRVLVLVDLAQDIDVLAPVLAALRDCPDLAPVVRVAGWLERESPRTAARLRQLGLAFAYVRRADVVSGKAPSLRGIAAVLAAAESSHPAHAAGHALARRAASAGIGAYTLQHGLENVGLYGLERAAARFASEHVFCWFPERETPADLPDGTAAKLLHVGRPSPLPARAAPPPRYHLGVFENLHWERYGADEREAFRAGLLAVARSLPELRILLRPHPAGRWSMQLGQELAPFPNIALAGPAELQEGASGGAEAVKEAGRVITTPSTIALDAAAVGAPTALAAPGGEVYAPLPELRAPEDWIAFARGIGDDRAGLDRFVSRVLVPGDASPRIVERLRRDLRRGPHGD
jgi:hypothetical protein